MTVEYNACEYNVKVKVFGIKYNKSQTGESLFVKIRQEAAEKLEILLSVSEFVSLFVCL